MYFNAVKMLKCELFNDVERNQIQESFRDNVCYEIKEFVMEYLYPMPNYDEMGKMCVKKESLKHKNKCIVEFVQSHLATLVEYVNSNRFNQYYETINFYANKLVSFNTAQKSKTVISLLRQSYIHCYCNDINFINENV